MAARWVHLLNGTVALQPDHGILHGVLLAAGCGRGPRVRCLRSCAPEILSNDITGWVWYWLTALFLQHVKGRSDLRSMLGAAASVLLHVDIA